MTCGCEKYEFTFVNRICYRTRVKIKIKSIKNPINEVNRKSNKTKNIKIKGNPTVLPRQYVCVYPKPTFRINKNNKNKVAKSKKKVPGSNNIKIHSSQPENNHKGEQKKRRS